MIPGPAILKEEEYNDIDDRDDCLSHVSYGYGDTP